MKSKFEEKVEIVNTKIKLLEAINGYTRAATDGDGKCESSSGNALRRKVPSLVEDIQNDIHHFEH